MRDDVDDARMPSWEGEPTFDETDGRWYRYRLSGCLGWREEVEVPLPSSVEPDASPDGDE